MTPCLLCAPPDLVKHASSEDEVGKGTTAQANIDENKRAMHIMDWVYDRGVEMLEDEGGPIWVGEWEQRCSREVFEAARMCIKIFEVREGWRCST